MAVVPSKQPPTPVHKLVQGTVYDLFILKKFYARGTFIHHGDEEGYGGIVIFRNWVYANGQSKPPEERVFVDVDEIVFRPVQNAGRRKTRRRKSRKSRT